MWTILSALEGVKRLQPIAHRYGYCLAIGGGVLNNGYSEHDLDVVAHTRTDAKNPDAEGLVRAIEIEAGLSIIHIDQEQHGPHSIVKLFLHDMPVLELWFVHHQGYKLTHPGQAERS